MATADGKHSSSPGKRVVIAVVILVILAGAAIGLTVVNGGLPGAGSEAALEYSAPTGLAELDEEDVAARAAANGETTGEPIVVAGPAEAGALAVKGASLVDTKGNPVQLRGVSLPSLSAGARYVNQKLFTQLKKDWGLNAVRLPVYPSGEGGYATGGDKAALEKAVVDGIRFAQKADLYVVVDWHIFTDGDPWWNAVAAQEFYGKVLAQVGDCDNVIYEICNEPAVGVGWNRMFTFATETIPQIRAVDPDAVVIVGTPNQCQDLTAPAENPVQADNVMYSLHCFAGQDHETLQNVLKTAVAEGVPVFVSEFSLGSRDAKGKADYESAEEWVKLMDDLGVSYICWKLDAAKDGASLLRTANKYRGFDAGDLSTQGAWLLRMHHAPGFDAESLKYAGLSSHKNKKGATMHLTGTDTMMWSAGIVEVKKDGKKTRYTYTLSGQNYSKEVSSWSVDMPFNGSVSLVGTQNAEAVVEDNVVKVKNDSGNGKVAAGDSVSGITVIVEGSSKLALLDEG